LAGAVVLVSGALVAVGWWKKWVGVAGLGWAMCLIAGIMLQPWNVFHGPQNPKDSDEIYWIGQWRMASVVWAAAFAGELWCVRVMVRRQQQPSSP